MDVWKDIARLVTELNEEIRLIEEEYRDFLRESAPQREPELQTAE